MTTILIAVDLTVAARHAATVAHDLFGPDATYLAINVADEPTARSAAAFGVPAWGSVFTYPLAALAPGPEDPHPVDEAERLARHVADEAGVTGAEAIGAVGDPADAILRAAVERQADVVVVGSHDRSWLAELVEGSVADDLVDTHAIPVLIVPGPSGELDDEPASER